MNDIAEGHTWDFWARFKYYKLREAKMKKK